MANGETNPVKANTTEVQKLVNEAYSSSPWWYNVRGFLILSFSYRTTLWTQVKFLEKNLSDNHLEIAVGTGTLLKFILLLRKLRKLPEPQIVAFDYAKTMVAGAKKAFAGKTNIGVLQGDVTRMSFPDNSFQSINIANGFHCFHDPNAALAEIWRVLAPNGSIAANILLYPHGPSLLQRLSSSINAWGVRHGLLVSPFDVTEVRNMFVAHGFAILEETISGNTVNIAATKLDVCFINTPPVVK